MKGIEFSFLAALTHTEKCRLFMLDQLKLVGFANIICVIRFVYLLAISYLFLEFGL